MSKKRHVGNPDPTTGRAEPASAAGVEAGKGASAAARRVASFVVEVVIDERGEVHRTSVLHVADDEQESWPGWEPRRVTDFVAGHVGLAAVRPVAAETGPPPAPPASEATDRPPRLRVVEVHATALAAASGLPLLVEGGPFEVQIALDPGETPPPKTVEYQAVVHAKLLGARTRQRVGEVRGRLAGGQRALLRVPAMAPPRGLYRLEMDLTLGGESVRSQAGVGAGLLQVG